VRARGGKLDRLRFYRLLRRGILQQSSGDGPELLIDPAPRQTDLGENQQAERYLGPIPPLPTK